MILVFSSSRRIFRILRTCTTWMYMLKVGVGKRDRILSRAIFEWQGLLENDAESWTILRLQSPGNFWPRYQLWNACLIFGRDDKSRCSRIFPLHYIEDKRLQSIKRRIPLNLRCTNQLSRAGEGTISTYSSFLTIGHHQIFVLAVTKSGSQIDSTTTLNRVLTNLKCGFEIEIRIDFHMNPLLRSRYQSPKGSTGRGKILEISDFKP